MWRNGRTASKQLIFPLYYYEGVYLQEKYPRKNTVDKFLGSASLCLTGNF